MNFHITPAVPIYKSPAAMSMCCFNASGRTYILIWHESLEARDTMKEHYSNCSKAIFIHISRCSLFQIAAYMPRTRGHVGFGPEIGVSCFEGQFHFSRTSDRLARGRFNHMNTIVDGVANALTLSNDCRRTFRVNLEATMEQLFNMVSRGSIRLVTATLHDALAEATIYIDRCRSGSVALDFAGLGALLSRNSDLARLSKCEDIIADEPCLIFPSDEILGIANWLSQVVDDYGLPDISDKEEHNAGPAESLVAMTRSLVYRGKREAERESQEKTSRQV